MGKTILLTGATDGIGYETAKKLVDQGHFVLLHGRNEDKLRKIESELSVKGQVEAVCADLSKLTEVKKLATDIIQKHKTIDILINNAGVFKVKNPIAENGLDQRFIVNTIAPFLLTQELLNHFAPDGRVINLSSAAQAPVELNALRGEVSLSDSLAYAQSKLAITMWTFYLAKKHKNPLFIAVNPASFLGSKMVKEAYGMPGKDLSIGADILIAASLSDDFSEASGKYYDNDLRTFSEPYKDALDHSKTENIVEVIRELISKNISS